jgi:hypothetical protein
LDCHPPTSASYIAGITDMPSLLVEIQSH